MVNLKFASRFLFFYICLNGFPLLALLPGRTCISAASSNSDSEDPTPPGVCPNTFVRSSSFSDKRRKNRAIVLQTRASPKLCMCEMDWK